MCCCSGDVSSPSFDTPAADEEDFILLIGASCNPGPRAEKLCFGCGENPSLSISSKVFFWFRQGCYWYLITW